jgi:hypothetical protein
LIERLRSLQRTPGDEEVENVEKFIQQSHLTVAFL